MIAGLRETANSPGRRISMEGFFTKLSPTRHYSNSSNAYSPSLVTSVTPRYVNFPPEQAYGQQSQHVSHSQPAGNQQPQPNRQMLNSYVHGPNLNVQESAFSPIQYQSLGNFGPRNYPGGEQARVNCHALPNQQQEVEPLALESGAPVRLKLGSLVAQYDQGKWDIDGNQVKSADLEKSLERNRQLEAENELLKFKISYLLDLLSTTKLDALQLQGEKKDFTVDQTANLQ